MAEPSPYELAAWDDLQHLRDRPLTRGMHWAGDQAAAGLLSAGRAVATFADDHPRVREAQAAVIDRVQTVRKAIPENIKGSAAEWSGQALEAVRRSVARVSQVGLTPDGIVAKHRKAGRDVTTLVDLRSLDLAHIDKVRGQGLNLYYPAAAAASGAGAGLVISGNELVITITDGATAAPSAAVIAATMAGDAAVVLGLACRAAGHVALLYGYDPQAPGEKLFLWSAVNAGTALSAGAKNRAMADLSRLTQHLYRSAPWKVLDESIIARVYTQFAKQFGVRVTKQSLGKIVPAVGIVLGAGLNWATLESVVDQANAAYRRRFLLDKYPELSQHEQDTPIAGDVPDDHDEEISILDDLAQLGGPDLRLGDANDPASNPEVGEPANTDDLD